MNKMTWDGTHYALFAALLGMGALAGALAVAVTENERELSKTRETNKVLVNDNIEMTEMIVRWRKYMHPSQLTDADITHSEFRIITSSLLTKALTKK